MNKNERFLLLLVPLLKKKPDNIILHFGTNDPPYKNEDEIYKELKSIKNFIKKQHPSCKVYISAPILRLDNKNANNILKKYVGKLKVVEEKSVILHDNILSSHLNKDGLHLNSYGTIKLADVTRVPIKNSNTSTALLPYKHQTLFPLIILVLIKIHPGISLNIYV